MQEVILIRKEIKNLREFNSKDKFNCKNNSVNIESIMGEELTFIAHSEYSGSVTMDGVTTDKSICAVVALTSGDDVIYITSPSPTLADSIADIAEYASDCDPNEDVKFKIVTKLSKAGRKFYIAQLL